MPQELLVQKHPLLPYSHLMLSFGSPWSLPASRRLPCALFRCRAGRRPAVSSSRLPPLGSQQERHNLRHTEETGDGFHEEICRSDCLWPGLQQQPHYQRVKELTIWYASVTMKILRETPLCQKASSSS